MSTSVAQKAQIVKDYQRKRMSLFLLWKGILCLLRKSDNYSYLIGPVSISNTYTKLSQEIMIEYIRKHHFDHGIAGHIKPRKPFVSRLSNVDTEILTEKNSDFNALDQIIRDIEPLNLKMPVLLRKYLDLGGKIASFNVDPQFSNTVDGFLILELSRIKPEIIQNLGKNLPA